MCKSSRAVCKFNILFKEFVFLNGTQRYIGSILSNDCREVIDLRVWKMDSASIKAAYFEKVTEFNQESELSELNGLASRREGKYKAIVSVLRLEITKIGFEA